MITYQPHKSATVVLTISLLLFTPPSVVTNADGKLDLSSPDATINTYCRAVKSADISLVRAAFFDQRIEEESYKKPIWTDCRIVERHKTKKIGMELGNGLVSQPGDVEVVQEVTMIDPAKGNPKTRFWYLLRDFSGEWKIISHSHIPDKNYPPID